MGTPSSSAAIWAEDRPRSLANVLRAGVDDQAEPSASSRTSAFERPVVGPDLMPRAMPRPLPCRLGTAPTDQLGGLIHALRPATIARRIERHELIAVAGEVAQPDLQRVDTQFERRVGDIRLDRPVDLRIAEATKCGRGDGVREHAPRVDVRAGPVVRAVADVRAFAHDPVGNIGIRADQVIRVDVLERERAVVVDAGANGDFRLRPDEPPRKLSSRLSVRRTGRPNLSAINASAGSYLACCLPPKAPPGSGAWTRTLDRGIPRTRARIRCSQYGCWIDDQTATPSPSGAAMNACGSMAKWVTIGKR